MTILQALDRYYERMAARGDVVAPGWSREPVGFVLVLTADGRAVDVKLWRDPSGKKPRSELVPKWFGRSGTGSTPFFLWENSAYALGVSDKDPVKTGRDHASFKQLHLRALHGVDDPALAALRKFVETWDPNQFELPLFSEQLFKANLAFQLDGDSSLTHNRPIVADLVERLRTTVEAGQRTDTTGEGMCLVRGKVLPIARLHRKIKGIDGTASAEVPLVSFEGEAFKSYGHDRGDNAPTSAEAAFRYSAALNALLERGVSRNRLKIGDATVAFWADASNLEQEESAKAGEELFPKWFDTAPIEQGPDKNLDADEQEADKLRDQLDKVAEGRPEEADPRLRRGMRFHVLGLAPNVARLSVRYWLDDDFSAFAKRLREHMDDLFVEPRPWRAKSPSISRLLVKTTALLEKFDNIPKQLAGEVMRAVLSGTPYPRTWLAAAIIRLRAGDNPRTGWHAAAIRACLNRPLRLRIERLSRESATAEQIAKLKKELLPVALEPTRPDPAYQLGRLFAVLEGAQYAALENVNAPIGDRYYAAASATPARVFGPLLRGLKNHVADARKRGKGTWIEPKVAEIIAMLPPDLPRTLKLEEQGRFAVGYYHECAIRFEKRLKNADKGKAAQ